MFFPQPFYNRVGGNPVPFWVKVVPQTERRIKGQGSGMRGKCLIVNIQRGNAKFVGNF